MGESTPSARDCLVLGSGRSGTSMMAGCLANSGYWSGYQLWEARDANPTGFFEDREINRINERLMASVMPKSLPRRLSRWVPGRLGDNQRWLAALPPETVVRSNPRIDEAIGHVVSHRPFAIKDPRFTYTMDAWEPLMPDGSAYVVVFRHPGRTIPSLAKEIADAAYLRNVRLSEAELEERWCVGYERILAAAAGDSSRDRWVFVHYDQIMSGSGIERLEKALRTEIDTSIVNPGLKRTAESHPASVRATAAYSRLCELADFEP